MIARAPGKLVLSGAYAVLEGAPAIVAAVDRYVTADASRTASFVTPEVAAALEDRGASRAPFFDARELRDPANGQKLGLGSSAAIVTASLAALELTCDPLLDAAALAARVFAPALAAHRRAQGGGSGIDVAASTWGGVLRFRRGDRADDLPTATSTTLPPRLSLTVWSSRGAASTAEMLGKIAAFREAHPAECRSLFTRLSTAAESAADATSAPRYIAACREQLDRFVELGRRSGAPIVSPEMQAFDEAISHEGALILPSGAGGGDVVLLLSNGPPSDVGASAARRFGFEPLSLSLGAEGVHAASAALFTTESNENEA